MRVLWLVVGVVLVVVLVVGVALWLSMSSSGSQSKPRIGIGDVSGVDVSRGKVYVRIINGDDRAYVISIRVEGCVDKTYDNIPIDALEVKDLAIDVPADKIVSGCQLKIYIIHKGEIIASKTLSVGLG